MASSNVTVGIKNIKRDFNRVCHRHYDRFSCPVTVQRRTYLLPYCAAGFDICYDNQETTIYNNDNYRTYFSYVLLSVLDWNRTAAGKGVLTNILGECTG